MEEETRGPRRRRVVTALLAAGVLAAVPAGVALAGNSSEGGSGDGSGVAQPTLQVQDGDRGERGGPGGGSDRGDCPEKDGAPSESEQL